VIGFDFRVTWGLILGFFGIVYMVWLGSIGAGWVTDRQTDGGRVLADRDCQLNSVESTFLAPFSEGHCQLKLERGQPYRRAKDFSAPDRRATHGRRIPPLLAGSARDYLNAPIVLQSDEITPIGSTPGSRSLAGALACGLVALTAFPGAGRTSPVRCAW
jgi:hypothetical protein